MKRFFCTTCKRVRRVRALPANVSSPEAPLPQDRVGKCVWHITNKSKKELRDRGPEAKPQGKPDYQRRQRRSDAIRNLRALAFEELAAEAAFIQLRPLSDAERDSITNKVMLMTNAELANGPWTLR